MGIHISKENSKLGNVLNISLPPGITCDPLAPCQDKCYAKKAYNLYSSNRAKPAWDENLAIYNRDPDLYFGLIVGVLRRSNKPWDKRYFRWHVGGDIPDERYLEGMHWVARELEDWQFLAYTRREWALGRKDRPDNLNVLRSLWIGDEEFVLDSPWFKVVLPDHTLYPINDVMCPGRCDQCWDCWYLDDGHGRCIYLH